MRRRVRIGIPALLVLCWLPWGGAGLAAENAQQPASAAPADVEELMRMFAASGGVRARFKETRHIAILAAPIETEGILYFAPPDRLARHTTRPDRSTVVVSGDEVTFSDEAGLQVMQLGSSEVARSLVGNLSVLLRGDLATLRDRYSIEFRSDGQEWVLDLEPRSWALRRLIERLRITGRGWEFAAMETRETGGDTAVLAFSDVETGLAPDHADFVRIFSLEGPDETP